MIIGGNQTGLETVLHDAAVWVKGFVCLNSAIQCCQLFGFQRPEYSACNGANQNVEQLRVHVRFGIAIRPWRPSILTMILLWAV